VRPFLGGKKIAKKKKKKKWSKPSPLEIKKKRGERRPLSKK